VKIFHNFVYCSFTWHCWPIIYFTELRQYCFCDAYFPKKIMQFNALCSTENISQMHWPALYKTEHRTGLLSHIPAHKL
jgi:hypothetical protein